MLTNSGAHAYRKASQSALMALLMLNARLPELNWSQRNREWNRIFTSTLEGNDPVDRRRGRDRRRRRREVRQGIRHDGAGYPAAAPSRSRTSASPTRSSSRHWRARASVRRCCCCRWRWPSASARRAWSRSRRRASPNSASTSRCSGPQSVAVRRIPVLLDGADVAQLVRDCDRRLSPCTGSRGASRRAARRFSSTMACHGSGARQPSPESAGNECAAARNGGDRALRPVQSRTADMGKLGISELDRLFLRGR